MVWNQLDDPVLSVEGRIKMLQEPRLAEIGDRRIAITGEESGDRLPSIRFSILFDLNFDCARPRIELMAASTQLRSMQNRTGFRYSLATLMWLVAAIGVPLGLSMSWTPFSSLLLCSAVALILWCCTRRRAAGICLLTYVALLPLAFIATFMVIGPNHPYVRRYNERLERIAMESRLIGSAEERVKIVLGNPTSVYSG